MATIWRTELHCHSNYSHDCKTSLEELISLCQKRQINCIALTDHNEIKGALELAKIAPRTLKVIVGEEIASAEGDVIGLFLKERIEPRLPIAETINAIRKQGGLVLLPHPTDRLRHEAVGETVTRDIASKIDFIETFNARNVFKADNAKAKKIATSLKLNEFVGSDAHTASEYGHALNLIKPFETTEEFLRNLQRAHFTFKKSSPWVHVKTAIVKRTKVKLKQS